MDTLKYNRTFHQIAALAGVVSPLIFILLVIVGGLQYDGYSHIAQAISELGATDSPVRTLQTLNFFIIGISLVVFFLGFHYRFPGSSNLTTGLLLYFALAAGVGNGVFPCDPGCDMVTTSGTLHNLTGLTGFIALSVGTILIGRRMRKFEGWSRFASYSQVTGFLILAFGVFWIVVGKITGIMPEYQGLLQRLMVLSFLQWFLVMGVYLLTQPMPETTRTGYPQTA